METKFYYIEYDSPIGVLTIQNNGEAITRIEFDGKKVEGVHCENAVGTLVLRELNEYFYEGRKEFTVPVKFINGTEFQKKVWEALREIPYGETRTYKQIAENVGSPKGCRAVGMANHNNPIPNIVPCHRVIGKNRKLVGFAGGLDIKTKLLELEGNKDAIYN